jgi:hypothetical protein
MTSAPQRPRCSDSPNFHLEEGRQVGKQRGGSGLGRAASQRRSAVPVFSIGQGQREGGASKLSKNSQGHRATEAVSENLRKRVRLLSRNLWRHVKLGYRSPHPPQRYHRYNLSRLHELVLARQCVMIFWKRPTQRRGLKCAAAIAQSMRANK